MRSCARPLRLNARYSLEGIGKSKVLPNSSMTPF